MREAIGVLPPSTPVSVLALAEERPVRLVTVAMILTRVLASNKQLESNQLVAGSNYRPQASSQQEGRRFFRRVAAAGFTVVTIDQKSSELLLGAVKLI